jgi:cytidylate kinase
LDNGSIFRSVSLSLRKNGIDITNTSEEELVRLILSTDINVTWNNGMCRIFLDGSDVSQELSDLEIGRLTSILASNKQYFTALAEVTRRLALEGNFVSDGRAVGTFIFPDANTKIFVSASPEVRAQRRFQDLISQGRSVVYDDVFADIIERDYRDKNREFCPLVPPDGCIMIDTSHSTSEESLREILMKINLDLGENDEYLPDVK